MDRNTFELLEQIRATDMYRGIKSIHQVIQELNTPKKYDPKPMLN